MKRFYFKIVVLFFVIVKFIHTQDMYTVRCTVSLQCCLAPPSQTLITYDSVLNDLRSFLSFRGKETSTCYYPGIGAIDKDGYTHIDVSSVLQAAEVETIIGSDFDNISFEEFCDAVTAQISALNDIENIHFSKDIDEGRPFYQVSFEHRMKKRTIRVYYGFDASVDMPPFFKDRRIDLIYLRNPGGILSSMTKEFRRNLFGKIQQGGFCYIGGVMGDLDETQEQELSRIVSEGFNLVYERIHVPDDLYLNIDHFLFSKTVGNHFIDIVTSS